MTVGELKELLNDIDDDKIVLIEDCDDLKVSYAGGAGLDEYKRRYIDSNDIPFCIYC